MAEKTYPMGTIGIWCAFVLGILGLWWNITFLLVLCLFYCAVSAFVSWVEGRHPRG